MKTKVNKSQQNLSIPQENAIELLILGKNDREVSEALNVNRSTVTEWRNHNPMFVAELNLRREELWDNQKTKISSLFKKAVNVLEKGLDSEDEKIRLETAKYLLERFGIEEMEFEPSGWTDSEKIESIMEETQKKKRREKEETKEAKRKEKIIYEKTKHLQGKDKLQAQEELEEMDEEEFEELVEEDFEIVKTEDGFTIQWGDEEGS